MSEPAPLYRITVFVPSEDLEEFVRKIQDHVPSFNEPYDRVMWWSDPIVDHGTGQFRPLKGANPHDGEIGYTERRPISRLEFLCPYDEQHVQKLITDIIKPAHSYEAPVVYYESIKNIPNEI